MRSPTSTSTAPIQVLLLPDLPDADGLPRAALLMPPPASAITRRPVLRTFATLGAAVEAKRRIEEAGDASP